MIMKRNKQIGLALLLTVLPAYGQSNRSRELNPIEKQKMELPALSAPQTLSPQLRQAGSPDYTKGTFIVNEDWYGHNNGSVNFLSDDGTWTYRAFQKENPGKQLGSTSQFGTIYGDKLYIVSKQAKDPGASITGSRLAVIDPLTMKVEKEFTTIGGADGRSFLGVDEHTGYIGTSNGIWLYNIDDKTIGEQISGTGNGGGSLYSAQIGTMIRVGKYVFAVHQKDGLLVIDAATHQITTTLLKPTENSGNGLGSAVLSKDGTIWVSPTQELSGSGGSVPVIWRVDPSTLTATKLAIPTNEGIEEIPNSWYAWTADGFCSSTRENKIYWKGQGSGSWFTGHKIYCYDIDRNSFYKVFDFTKLPGDWRLYGAGFRIDPVSDDMYCFLYHEFLKLEHELAVIATNGSGETNGTIRGRYPYEEANYWFPALPVFPDNEAPSIKSNAPKEVSLTQANNIINIPLESIVEDKDNMTASIVTTITMDDTYKGLITADVQNNTLVIKPSMATIADEATIPLSLKFNSNGKVANMQLTVKLDAGTTAPFELSAKELLLDKGKTATLTVKGLEDEAATWVSSDTQIATVSDAGVITANSSGLVTITATSTTREGITATCNVTVKRENLVLDASTVDLFDNAQTTLVKVASGWATNTEKLTWATSDEDIVSISSSNPNQVVIKTNAIGTAEITGTISLKNDDQNTPLATAKCVVTVNKLIPVERIELKPVDLALLDQDPVAVEINKSVSFVATVYPENASIKTVTWNSSNPSSFSVANGVVTAKGNGSAVIMASSSQGGDVTIEKSASANVTCTFELEKVYFEKEVYGIEPDGYIQIPIRYSPAKPSNISVSVSSDSETEDWVFFADNTEVAIASFVASGEIGLVCQLTDDDTKKEYTATCRILCSKWVKSFKINEDNKLLKIEDTFSLTYTLDNTNLTDEEKATKKVLFSSDNPEVASVSDEGLVTAKKPGKANITAYLSDGSYSLVCQVLVGENWAEKVSCLQDTVRVAQMGTVQLSATVEPHDISFPSVTWSSEVGGLNSEGLFTANNVIGKVIAAATSLDKMASDTCVICTIGKIPLTGLNLTPNELSVDINDSEEAGIVYSKLLNVNFVPTNASLIAVAYGKYESMTSSDESVLKVNKSNLQDDYRFKPQKIGTTQVTVIAVENNIQGTVTIHVTDRSTGITGISLNASNMVEESGKTLTIGHHVSIAQDAEGDIDKTVKWESSNPEVATINSSTGKIETLSEGETVIRATTNKGGFTTTCRLFVSKGTVKVAGISLNYDQYTLEKNDAIILQATITPSNATDKAITWVSTDNTIATVSNGLVTALAPGTTTIIATSSNSQCYAICRITVKANDVEVQGPVIEPQDSTATLTFDKVADASLYKVSIYQYKGAVPFLYKEYFVDSNGHALDLNTSRLIASSNRVSLLLLGLNPGTLYMLKLEALKVTAGKQESLKVFYTEPFLTKGNAAVDNEAISLAEQAVFYANHSLYFTNMEGYTCYVMDMAGHIKKMFRTSSSEEKCPLYLHQGVYIVTAIKDNKRITQKILINN